MGAYLMKPIINATHGSPLEGHADFLHVSHWNPGFADEESTDPVVGEQIQMGIDRLLHPDLEKT